MALVIGVIVLANGLLLLYEWSVSGFLGEFMARCWVGMSRAFPEKQNSSNLTWPGPLMKSTDAA